ncbi:peroxiredoxin family protein [Streptomyces sp. NBC_00887]|uniref:peroxiredoxin family protein n=1 Tax=Streptomyces sp. NBC_00887 TaxID=2975859 RepID=UPI00386C72B5|nr:hypothetical protein OG844_00745 [Streptomyces sp. NBC_00887]WSY36286.1 hypothetical protein OG844_44850 [Streptomyces sp. NBC_00887]
MTRTLLVRLGAAAATAAAALAVSCTAQPDRAEPTPLTTTGHPTLVAFLATETTGADPSALQITTLKSMAQQYGPAGLRTVIVDTAKSTPDQLVNFGHDWQLGDISVRPDPDGSLAEAEDVNSAPAVLLFDKSARLSKRWDGRVNNPDLAFALQALGLDRAGT